MKAKAPGTMQRASRTRIAVALCAAGLIAGTLSSNLIGAGADTPAPVPGESVAAPPTQVPASTTSTTAAPDPSTAPAANAGPPDPPAQPHTAPVGTGPAPGPGATDPATPAPTTPTTAAPQTPAASPATPAPAGSPATPATAGAPAAAQQQPVAPRPAAADPTPLGDVAGAPQAPAAATCVSTAAARRAAAVAAARRKTRATSRLLASAKSASPSRARRSVPTCTTKKAKKTVKSSTGGAPAPTPAKDHREALRNSQGVPTLANPSTSLALPGPAVIGVPNFFIDKFRIPVFLLPIYQAAGIQYGVRWEVLAAINEIETDYGRNLNVSSAGALGWMQFMPATWKRYGVDANRDGRKDPFNPVDAIFAAARYLKAAGAADDLRNAIFAYNHADWYVESVLMRARLIGGLPSGLVGSLSGLTQGHFPVYAKARYADDLSEKRATRRVKAGTNAAMPVESDSTRRGIDIFAAAGSPVSAVQDGRIVGLGESRRLGRFIRLRDVYGNTYTYAHLKKLATRVAVPKAKTQSKASIAKELALPKADPKPTRAATAGRPTHKRPSLGPPTPRKPAAGKAPAKERLFAHPGRPGPLANGGARQLLDLESTLAEGETLKSYFTGAFGLDENDVVLKPLIPGRKVIAGTILGRIGTTDKRVSPHVYFEIRPSGRGAPRVDPKPILDGWKLLEATAIYRAKGRNPLASAAAGATSASIGQIMLMSKEALQQRVLSNPRIDIYSCGRRDIEAGGIDRRILATLEFLAASGLKPTVTSLHCGHGYYTAGGNVSEHSSGSAVDIAMINGIPILGHQGEGSITDITIRRLLTLQGTMKPHQIISLMTYKDADNTLALADHDDHIHVGFHPEYAAGTPAAKELASVLKPAQWIKLIDRLGQIHNPTVAKRPSKYAITVPVSRASTSHSGE
jgi:soluble lytic murein transglycosylase-like protein